MPPHYDAIVVGAGTAGCVVAARLSEDPDRRVLLIEAGGSDRSALVRIPLLTLLASTRPGWNWSFETEPIAALEGRRQVWNQGRLVGGSSSINGMIYMRGAAREYDAWAAAGCTGWSFAELLPLFRRSEANARGNSLLHGGDGPLPVRPCALDLPAVPLFLKAMGDAGFALLDDLNGGAEEGFGRFDCNIAGGRRVSAADAFLRPALGRPNLELITDRAVARVIIERGRATGVELVSAKGGIARIDGDEIMLCAGALKSPAILLASGVGPVDDLAAAGVAVRVANDEVGANLRNHPAHFQRYRTAAPISAYRYLHPWRGAGACLDYALHRRGPFAESFSAIGGMIRSDPAEPFADTIVVMIPSLLDRPSGTGARLRDLLPREEGIMVSTALGRPHSSGRVRLRSADPADPPRIEAGSFADPRDLHALTAAVAKMRAALGASPLAAMVSPERRATDFSEDPAAIAREIRATAGSLSHPTGSCRMGADPQSVVDPQLRVRGVAGLRVADVSILPGGLNACPHAVALMIGEKASDLVRHGITPVTPAKPVASESARHAR